LEVFCNIKVPNISLDDQQSISRYLDEKIKYLDEKIKYLDEKIKSTLSLKESLEKLKQILIFDTINRYKNNIKVKFVCTSIRAGGTPNTSVAGY
jgi:predicted aldo/keto reductase-like oxidoreductase